MGVVAVEKCVMSGRACKQPRKRNSFAGDLCKPFRAALANIGFGARFGVKEEMNQAGALGLWDLGGEPRKKVSFTCLDAANLIW